MRKLMTLITLLALSGCSSLQNGLTRSQIPDEEFQLLTERLNEISKTLNASESVISVIALNNKGEEKGIAEFPSSYEFVPEVINNQPVIDIQSNNNSVSKISIPSGYEQIRIKQSPSQRTLDDSAHQNQSWLIQQTMDEVKEFYNSYTDNPYIKVTGFSLEIGIIPSVSIDFEFKQ